MIAKRTAGNFESIDWITISRLYVQLFQNNSNPFVELNYAIALYFSGKKEMAFKILNGLRQKPVISQYYLLNATLGKINYLEGNYTKAKEFFIKTIGQTNFQAEKDFILRMINKMNRAATNKTNEE